MIREMTQEEFDDLNDLFTNVITTLTRNYDASVISRMFRLHNLIFPPNYSQSCGSCRKTVHDKLKDYWEGNKTKFGY